MFRQWPTNWTHQRHVTASYRLPAHADPQVLGTHVLNPRRGTFTTKSQHWKKIDFKNNFILYERWVSGLDTEWDFLNKFSSQRSVYSCCLKSSKLDLRAQLKMKWQLETTQQMSKTRARTKFEQVAATIISKNFEPANSSERRSFNWNYWKRGKLWRV